MSTPAIVDTLYLVPHDTLFISRPDTLIAALHSTDRTPTDWLLAILPSLATVASFFLVVRGWHVAHRNAMKAQNKQMHNTTLHNSAHIVATELIEYMLWLIEIGGYVSKVYDRGPHVGTAVTLLRKELDSGSATRWATIVLAHKYTLRPIARDLDAVVASLLASHTSVFKQAADSANLSNRTPEETRPLADRAARDTNNQIARIEDLRDRLLVDANNYVFPDHLVTRDVANVVLKRKAPDKAEGNA